MAIKRERPIHRQTSRRSQGQLALLEAFEPRLLMTGDVTAPVATLVAKDYYGLIGSTTYRFQVKYVDDTVMDSSTINGNNTAVRVTGPNGFSAFATRIAAVGVGAHEIDATYQFTAPGGTWSEADAGAYAAIMSTNSVKDTSGNAVAGGVLGLFYYSPTVAFDERYYLNKYADIRTAVQNGGFTSGYYHFVHFGQTEGRSPSEYYNETFYLNKYPAVATAVANHTYLSGWDQFVHVGLAAGNQGGWFFDNKFYEFKNADVANSVGTGFNNSLEHFLNFGQYEGRTFSYFYNDAEYKALNPDAATAVSSGLYFSGVDYYLRVGRGQHESPSSNFNEMYYLTKYADINNAVNVGAFVSGLQHFVIYGISEGRDASATYNESYYLSHNPDIATAVTNHSFPNGFYHWVYWGKNEGRIAHA